MAMVDELIGAIKGGFQTKVASLLHDGCSPNTEGDLKPIIIAAESGQDTIIELLLDSGADINVVSQVRSAFIIDVGYLLILSERVDSVDACISKRSSIHS